MTANTITTAQRQDAIRAGEWGMSRNEEYEQKIDESLKLMELRDRFAAAVLNGLYSSGEVGPMPFEVAAYIAYRQADAMVKRREDSGNDR